MTGSLIGEGSPAPVTGTLGMQDGCVVVEDEDGAVTLAVAPIGYRLSEDGQAVEESNGGQVALGSRLESSTGWTVALSTVDESADVRGLGDCADVSDSLLVFGSLEGLPRQE